MPRWSWPTSRSSAITTWCPPTRASARPRGLLRNRFLPLISGS
jgi:hypothetical protein